MCVRSVAEVGEVVAEREDDLGDFASLLSRGIMCHNHGLFSSNANDSLFALYKSALCNKRGGKWESYLSALDGFIVCPDGEVLFTADFDSTAK